jgi:hypothetical protein
MAATTFDGSKVLTWPCAEASAGKQMVAIATARSRWCRGFMESSIVQHSVEGKVPDAGG